MPRPLGLVPLLAVAWLLAAAAPAAASTLVYTCGAGYENLCLARPDGWAQRELTDDGDASRTTSHVYTAPDLSRDGRRLAYVLDNHVFVRTMASGATDRGTAQNLPLLVRLRNDGARMAVAVSAPLPTGGFQTEVCTYDASFSGPNEGAYCLAGGVGTGFDYLPDGRLVMATAGQAEHGGHTVIALLRPEDGGASGVERYLVADPAANLESPAVSPDGRLVAVVRAASGTRGDLALYDLSTGALVRTLTSGGRDGAPSFSPDGASIAFERADGSIWVTRADGSPGSERLVIARGRAVSWGGGDLPGPALARFPRRVDAGALRRGVRLVLTGLQAGDRVSATLLRQGRTVARARSTTDVVRLRPSGRAIRRLGARATLALRVTIRARQGARIDLRRTLRYRSG
jgi:Tol biopolymer transport system component